MRRFAYVLSCFLVTACGMSATIPVALTPGQTTQAQGIWAKGAGLFTGDGTPVRLRGMNYFGFNNGQTMVDGLWGNDPLSMDFATVVQRQRALGFNAVRLPFSFQDLQALRPRSFAQPCQLPSQADIARSVTPPGGKAPAIQPLTYPPKRAPGQCNDYLPSDTVWNRYKWVVRFYARNGFYVLVDNHLREDQTALQDPARWAGLWARLVRELAADPEVARRLMVDVLNEPDQYGVRWEAAAGRPGLGDLYLRAMDAIDATGARPLYFLEGTGQGSLQANWGDGFDTDGGDIARLGLSDPRPFFRALLSRRYRRQVVLAPHVYGPAVTTNPNATEGAALDDRLSRSFGYLTKDGFCDAGRCTTFPVAVGEFGSKMERQDDVRTMLGLRDYLLARGGGADGRHVAIPNWFWWSWNANSGDTGGLVKDDWVGIQWSKIDLLKGLGL